VKRAHLVEGTAGERIGGSPKTESRKMRDKKESKAPLCREVETEKPRNIQKKKKRDQDRTDGTKKVGRGEP